MSDASGQVAWSYDSMGRVRFERRTTNGYSRQYNRSYNKVGSLESQYYSGGRTVLFDYDSAGRLDWVRDDGRVALDRNEGVVKRHSTWAVRQHHRDL